MKRTRRYKEFCNKTNNEELINVEYILNSKIWIKGRLESCSNKTCPFIANCKVYDELDQQIPYGY